MSTSISSPNNANSASSGVWSSLTVSFAKPSTSREISMRCSPTSTHGAVRPLCSVRVVGTNAPRRRAFRARPGQGARLAGSGRKATVAESIRALQDQLQHEPHGTYVLCPSCSKTKDLSGSCPPTPRCRASDEADEANAIVEVRGYRRG